MVPTAQRNAQHKTGPSSKEKVPVSRVRWPKKSAWAHFCAAKSILPALCLKFVSRQPRFEMRALCFLLLAAFVSVVGAGGDGWVLGNRVAVTLPSLSKACPGQLQQCSTDPE
jgi:hypothetical protein